MLKQGVNPRRAIVIHTYQLNLTFSDEPDRSWALQPNPLLRTVRESFPSYGSSPYEGSTSGGSRPEGTRDFTIVIDCQHDRSLRAHHAEVSARQLLSLSKLIHSTFS